MNIGAVEPARRLPRHRAKVCGTAVGNGEEDRAWPDAGDGEDASGTKGDQQEARKSRLWEAMTSSKFPLQIAVAALLFSAAVAPRVG